MASLKTLEEIKSILAKHKEETRGKYKVEEIGIFGSYVRGEQGGENDLDMIIEFEAEESIGGLEFVGLMTDLEEYFQKILGAKVHLASTKQAIKSDKWKYTEKDLIYI